MARRFSDTDKFKKSFFRGLPGPYKLFWEFLCCDCNHAGIWHKDFEIAQIYLGKDMPIKEEEALRLFNQDEERIRVVDDGRKWVIVPFAGFQYGKLNPENRVHYSVLFSLSKFELSPLQAPCKGAKDKDKDKDKDLDMDKDKDGVNMGTANQTGQNAEKRPETPKTSKNGYSEAFEGFWAIYPRKVGKGGAWRVWRRLKPGLELVENIKTAIVRQKGSVVWQKDGGAYIPNPETWLNQERWLDELPQAARPTPANAGRMEEKTKELRELADREWERKQNTQGAKSNVVRWFRMETAADYARAENRQRFFPKSMRSRLRQKGWY